MNSVKVGNFMKALRKEKGLTQEQLAQAFRVSRRTVSRWETGSNLPDMEILIEMADFYDVDLREILDGQRRDGKMNKELEETVRKVAITAKRKERNHPAHAFYVPCGPCGGRRFHDAAFS